MHDLTPTVLKSSNTFRALLKFIHAQISTEKLILADNDVPTMATVLIITGNRQNKVQQDIHII